MKKRTNKVKGEMLIETVVAMAVFAIMITSAFRAYKAFSAVSKNEAAYAYFESVCSNIDYYYDNLGYDYWYKEFFGDYCAFEPTRRVGFQRYNADYELLPNTFTRYTYELEYRYIEKIFDGKKVYELVVNIENVENGKKVIYGLNFGPSLANEKDDINYYVELKNNNIGIKQHYPGEEEIIEETSYE